LLWSPADTIAMRAAGRSLRTRRNKLLWKRDPVAWVHDRLGERTWSKQEEALWSLAQNPRTAVKSCHGIGKSHLASRGGMWWVDTADNPADRFLVTTAPTTAQVRAILWRYIRSGWRAHELPGRVLQNAEWKVDDELIGYGRKPADHDESAFQGIHALEGVLVEIDEACGVPHQLFVAADALATNDASRVLAIGNPDDNSAHFQKVCTKEPGWNVISISAFDSPNFTGEPVSERMAESLVSRWWVEDKRQRWGETNPLYIAKVLGEFADAEDGLIPMSWIKAAQARWIAWAEARDASPTAIGPPGPRYIAVDVARFGEDKTAIAHKQGQIVHPDGEIDHHGQAPIETHAKLDNVEVARVVRSHMRPHPKVSAIVDVVGVGSGVYDILTHAGLSTTSFAGSRRTKMRDLTGEFTFDNVRSAAWWNLRELLDPGRPGGATLALPPDDDLAADLATPKWDLRAGGVLVVESKDETRKRLGHSPDVGDAVTMLTWVDSVHHEEASLEEDPRAAEPVPHADAYADATAPTPLGGPLDPVDFDVDDYL
jgi:hypothetical protein